MEPRPWLLRMKRRDERVVSGSAAVLRTALVITSSVPVASRIRAYVNWNSTERSAQRLVHRSSLSVCLSVRVL